MRIHELAPGQSASAVDVVTPESISAFAAVSGDCNPVHLDADFAATTPFKGVIAHGILSAAFISKVLGMVLPGPGCVYLGQTLRFRAPVRPGDSVQTEVVVRAVRPDKRVVVLDTICRVGATVVLEGEATLLAAA